MKRTETILITTVILSIALTSVFALDFNDDTNSVTQAIPFSAEAHEVGTHHEIQMEAVKMPDGMYAYRMVSYTTSEGDDLVASGVYKTKPSIPGPTLVFTEGDSVDLTLTNKACDDFVIGDAGNNENSYVGIHVHGVHYDISDDATYGRVNMDGTSAASCSIPVEYHWDVGLGTEGTWPYHDHTFYRNEVGGEDLGLFGTVIVNPASGMVNGLVNSGDGSIDEVSVEDIDKEFVLWMVSSETLGRSVFYGMEIDNAHPDIPGKQTALWTNPPLQATDGDIVRFHVLGLGDETHAFHLHGHRWVEAQGGSADIIDVEEITPLQRKAFLVKVSDNGDDNDPANDVEGWMYHCHVFAHMQAGMSGMLTIVQGDDTLPDVGAVFTLSDEPGLWMKTLDAGIVEGLDEYLEGLGLLDPGTSKPGTGFPLNYLGNVLSPEFADSQGRSLAVIQPGETVLFGMKDSQTKHTITSLIFPTEAMTDTPLGGNGILNSKPGNVGVALFDTQLPIRGSTFLTDLDGKVAPLEDPGLYVFVCQIHPYMISAVIVDDPDTSLTATNAGNAWLPLLDLSDNLTILTRAFDPDSNAVEFPVTTGPTNPLPLELLKDFYVISDPSNWKDYTQDSWDVNLVPAFLTTNTEAVVAQLHTDTASVNATINGLGLVGTSSLSSPTPIGANLDVHHVFTSSESDPPEDSGVGQVWVNTQFERTVNKNPDGTSMDKPGTITVIDASDWSLDKKISLPEINMNHPHNMWTDAKNEIVYQTQWFDSRMVAIDRESGEMIKDNFVGQSPAHVMTSPATGKIYITNNGEEQVTELDPNTYEITRQISTGPLSHPHGHWISSDGKYLVTPDFMSLSSTITNLEDNTTTKAQDGGSDAVILAPIATGMLGNTEDRKYYTADFLGNTLTVIDPETAQVIKQIDLLEVGAGLPIQTPVSPDDKWELTANLLGPNGAAITIVDTSIDEIVATLPCDPGCHGVQWGAKDDSHGGYYAYVSSKFSNALIVVDPDPNNDGDGMDATVVGKVILADRRVDSDDRVVGYDGMGGQGVLAIPNVYDGWIQQTVESCGPPVGKSHNFHAGPCSEEIADYLSDLRPEQLNPLE